MKRREFLAKSCVAGAAVGAIGHLASEQAVADEHPEMDKQLVELRTYTCASPEKQAVLLDVLTQAAIPAWNRVGVSPVGVLVAKPEDNQGIKNVDVETIYNQVFVVMTHQSPITVGTANRQLLADEEYLQGAAPLFDAPMKDPVYLRYSSSLLLSFDECPKVEVPTMAEGRLLQLRIYESHNEQKAAKKIDMFNLAGELELFRECGMDPVLFGEELIGQLMPNLTYMLSFDDLEAKDAAWKKFIASPKWDAMKNDPQYADTVSRITNIMLRPAAGSQI